MSPQSHSASYARLLCFLVAVTYFVYAAYTPHTWHLIDGANLLIHEGGHGITIFFGEFINIAAGSLLQILFPVLFSIYFFFRKEIYSACVTLLWMGESMVNVGIYAGDALDMSLPLIGGEDVIHDWNYLLTHTNTLSHAQGIGLGIKSAGLLIIIVAVVIALVHWKNTQRAI